MPKNPSPTANNSSKPTRSSKQPLFIGAILAACLLVPTIFWLRSGNDANEHVTFAVRRGNLNIKVLEGGNLQAIESQRLTCEVKGYQGVKILDIVEEGYYITEQDVVDKKILVELDSSELEDKLTTSEIQFKGTEASLTEAQQAYEIQINQNTSDMYTAEVELRLARLELEKYLGSKVTDDILAEFDAYDAKLRAAELITESPAQSNTEDASAPTESIPAREKALTVGSSELEETGEGVPQIELSSTFERPKSLVIDFSKYAKPELLGDGEANQKLRKLQDDFLMSKRELGIAKSKYEGTMRLFKMDFVTDNERENDEMEVQRKTISMTYGDTSMNQFIQYEFPKEAETRLSAYVQAQRKLERTEKQGISEMAKATAKQSSAEARFRIEQEVIKEYKEQIEKCTIYAPAPGLVVYGGESSRFFGNNEPIKKGTTVRERQVIITIPDTTKMSVEIKVHESDVNQVKKGQKVAIRVDSRAEEALEGEVESVAVLPNSEDMWINPEMKSYKTSIHIAGTHDWLKPGMSAEVEILIKTLDDILYIPLQSVMPRGNNKVCYVLEGGEALPRTIKTGDMSVEYIEVKEGLRQGEAVLVSPPEGARMDETDTEKFAEQPTEETATDDKPTDAPEGSPIDETEKLAEQPAEEPAGDDKPTDSPEPPDDAPTKQSSADGN